MNTALPDPLPRPVFPLPDHEMERLRSQLLQKLEKGLSTENIESRRRRPGLRIVIDGKIIHVWLGYYLDQRWWRITCGWGSDHPAFTQSMNKFAELTCCFEELDNEIGVHLARLLRAPEGYRWPMFGHDQTYPNYAWSVQGWKSYCVESEIRQAYAARRKARERARMEVA